MSLKNNHLPDTYLAGLIGLREGCAKARWTVRKHPSLSHGEMIRKRKGGNQKVFGCSVRSDGAEWYSRGRRGVIILRYGVLADSIR